MYINIEPNNMAGIRISELDKFSYGFVKDNADNIIIPASRGDDETGTINVQELLQNVIEDSDHEKNQNTAIATNTQNITNLSTEVNQHNTKIENIENIIIWDKETFH